MESARGGIISVFQDLLSVLSLRRGGGGGGVSIEGRDYVGFSNEQWLKEFGVYFLDRGLLITVADYRVLVELLKRLVVLHTRSKRNIIQASL